MKRLDRIDTQTLAAVLALLGLGLGVAWVASPGWALIVMSALVLLYIVLPDQRATP
jgi:hypothetical protein